MKKSMAGQGVAGALLLAGLMVSAGAMAASGDPVTGGSGTVTINVPIVTSTCSVSVPTEVNLDPINKNSLPNAGLVESKNFDTVFSNCEDKTLQMSVQASNPMMSSSSYAYFDSGDPDHAFYYNIQPPQDAEITGGATLASTRVFAIDNTLPVLIKPGSDNYTMSSNVNLYRGLGGMANVGSAISTSFTYNITYQ
ncbi:type 1 fimbrial protein [Salmonella enterica]|uniref:Type 1 fimbrial protein n=1 Tax=Salmonella montevideo TaxID=115981 RepID=A0A612C755_SALMO|nr:type 1 fimbrial protein [Salmonella enterica]ECV9758959.1 type 1 fimbrial protein [Salmonella enterica subsp. enterica serovar Montevideo]EHL4602752.1 type 1 fimbrial protein [Salmonella enterica subsp. enterica serovar Glostrup]EAW4993600.1 type 1 fimbrial protein [Salmonella enterica]EBM0567371.1 type 1 fimbrial protein [Salmonella enterica]